MNRYSDQRSDARKIVTAALLVLSSFALPRMAPAAEHEGNAHDRWTPSLAVKLSLTIQDAEGSVSSRNVGTGAALRTAVDNQKTLLSPQVGAHVELMSPSVAIPGRPRFFFDFEATSVSNQAQRVAREGDPSGLVEPTTAEYPVGAILGRGSSTIVDLENFAFGGGVGIAFPVTLGDWNLLIKPSARYIRRTYTFRGAVLDAFRPNRTGPTRRVELRGREDLATDSVGPGLEIEVEVLEVGSFMTTVFASGSAYRVLGNRDVAFSTSGLDSLGVERFRGSWAAEIDPWIYRAGVGFRMKWAGLPSGWLGRGGH